MTTAAPSTALATIQPAFTDPERLKRAAGDDSVRVIGYLATGPDTHSGGPRLLPPGQH